MITAEPAGERLILSEDGDPRAAYAGMSALSPVLLGFTLPIVAVMLLVPVAFHRAGPILIVLLTLLFVVSTGIFLVSVFCKGPITALAARPRSGTLEIYRSGPFATSQQHLALAQIAGLDMVTRYDRDGYATSTPLLRLEDGTTLDVTIDVDAAEIRRFRQALGLRGL